MYIYVYMYMYVYGCVYICIHDMILKELPFSIKVYVQSEIMFISHEHYRVTNEHYFTKDTNLILNRSEFNILFISQTYYS